MKPSIKLAAIGLLCAVPFGLAVRDELRGPAHAEPADVLFSDDELEEDNELDEDDELDELDDEGTGQPGAAGGQFASLTRPATAAEMRAPVWELTGAAPASLGPVFDGIRLGASSQDFLGDAARTRLETFKAKYDAIVDFDFDEREVLAIDASLAWPDAVRESLIARWGQPSDDNVWIDGKGQRVAVSARDGRANLRWSAYQTLDQLLAPGQRDRLGIEPFPVVGASIDRLGDALGGRLVESDAYDDQYAWDSPALADGDEPVRATALVAGGKVVELTVLASGGDPDAARAALVAKYGKPSKQDGEPWESASWRGKRTVEAVVGEDGLRLSIRR